MSRHFFDEVSHQRLCLPDTLLFRVSAIQESGGVKRCTISVAFQCSELDLAAVPNSRPIVLDNTFISISRPDDDHVRSFRFVQTDSLSGDIVLSFPTDYEEAFFELLTNEPNYLKPYYKGDSEEYYKSREVARAIVTSAQVQDFNANNLDLLVGLKRIEGLLRSQIADPEYRAGVFGNLLNDNVQITRSFAEAAMRWKIEFAKPDAISVSLVYVLPTITPIVGKAENLAIVVEPVN
jgi:hypothetical protein